MFIGKLPEASFGQLDRQHTRAVGGLPQWGIAVRLIAAAWLFAHGGAWVAIRRAVTCGGIPAPHQDVALDPFLLRRERNAYVSFELLRRKNYPTFAFSSAMRCSSDFSIP